MKKIALLVVVLAVAIAGLAVAQAQARLLGQAGHRRWTRTRLRRPAAAGAAWAAAR